jgi:hypothetical protein
MMSKFLGWLQERIKHWTTPSSVLIIGTLSDLTRSRTNLVIENALLGQQLIVLNRQIKRVLATSFIHHSLFGKTVSFPYKEKRRNSNNIFLDRFRFIQ